MQLPMNAAIWVTYVFHSYKSRWEKNQITELTRSQVCCEGNSLEYQAKGIFLHKPCGFRGNRRQSFTCTLCIPVEFRMSTSERARYSSCSMKSMEISMKITIRHITVILKPFSNYGLLKRIPSVWYYGGVPSQHETHQNLLVSHLAGTKSVTKGFRDLWSQVVSWCVTHHSRGHNIGYSQHSSTLHQCVENADKILTIMIGDDNRRDSIQSNQIRDHDNVTYGDIVWQCKIIDYMY